jgi:hypothetical protein
MKIPAVAIATAFASGIVLGPFGFVSTHATHHFFWSSRLPRGLAWK